MKDEASNTLGATNDRAETTARYLAPSSAHSPKPSTVSPLVRLPATWSQTNSATPTPPATPNTSASPCQPYATKKTASGSSFIVIEDQQMVKAWVRVSEDAFIGRNQKGMAFFKAIFELNNEIKPPYCQLPSAKSVKKQTKKDTTGFS